METSNFKNHSGENEAVKSTIVANGAKSAKRKRDEPPYLKIRSKAVSIFRNQIDKSIKTKKLAVKTAMDKVISGEYTRERFLSEFKANVDILLDSKRFERECQQHNLNPFNAATHIVFDGTSRIEMVLKNGLYPSYSTRLTELVDPLFTEDELNKASSVKPVAATE